MTHSEFMSWLPAVYAMFPLVENQFAKAADARKTLAAAWFEIVEPFGYDEAVEALQRILAGTDTGPGDFESHLMPRFVADSCVKARRREADAAAASLVTRDVTGKRRMAWESRTPDIKRQLVECHAAGGDALALADQLMPIDDDLRSRHRCPHCLDDGMVTVWAPRSIELAQGGKLEVGSHGVYRRSMACSCSAGDRFAKRTIKGKEVQLVRFDPERFCKCDGFTRRDVEKLVEWCLATSNYEPAFDDWNNG